MKLYQKKLSDLLNYQFKLENTIDLIMLVIMAVIIMLLTYGSLHYLPEPENSQQNATIFFLNKGD